MKKIVKGNQKYRRATLKLGDDEFCLDEDGEVYKNGFGQVFAKETLNYLDKGVKKRISYSEIFDMIFVNGIDEKEAVRIMRIKAVIPKSQEERRKMTRDAVKAHRMKVIRSDGSISASMTKAAKKLGCSRSAVSRSVNHGTKIKGYTFQVLTE